MERGAAAPCSPSEEIRPRTAGSERQERRRYLRKRYFLLVYAIYTYNIGMEYTVASLLPFCRNSPTNC